jgi:ABC-2 type transport system permease protein
VGARIREIYARREILVNLVRKELKVKYAASVLGALWSVLNPIVFLAVFTFVTKVLGNSIPNYPVFLLSGLLAWNLFANTLLTGSRAVVDNANLVKKVSFPREILPLSTLGVSIVDLVLQTAVLFIFMLATGYGFHLSFVLYPLAIAVLLVFTLAVTFWASSLNVRYRDVQHLLNLALLVWFWFTPIVYPAAKVQALLTKHPVLGINPWKIFLLNPMTPLIVGLQRALYHTRYPVTFAKGVRTVVPVLPFRSTTWFFGILLAALVASLVLLYITWRLFFRLSGDFAEEL